MKRPPASLERRQASANKRRELLQQPALLTERVQPVRRPVLRLKGSKP